MIHHILPVGPLQCNCSILGCERTKEAVVIDPGDEGERIGQKIQELGLTVKYILHTHAHFDHVGGTARLHSQAAGVPCLHHGDRQLYENVATQGRLFGISVETPPPVEKWLVDTETLRFGDHSLEVLHTPGHSPGSICLRLGNNEAHDSKIFSGDTLFQLSVGRADLWGGDADTLIQSIKTRLLTLDDDLPVYPGHGPATKIGFEKRDNPFLT